MRTESLDWGDFFAKRIKQVYSHWHLRRFEVTEETTLG